MSAAWKPTLPAGWTLDGKRGRYRVLDERGAFVSAAEDARTAGELAWLEQRAAERWNAMTGSASFRVRDKGGRRTSVYTFRRHNRDYWTVTWREAGWDCEHHGTLSQCCRWLEKREAATP